MTERDFELLKTFLFAMVRGNSIYLGGGKFNGHGIDPGTEEEILKRLAEEYNKPTKKEEKKHLDYSCRYRWDQTDPCEIPYNQWDTVRRLDPEAVDMVQKRQSFNPLIGKGIRATIGQITKKVLVYGTIVSIV